MVEEFPTVRTPRDRSSAKGRIVFDEKPRGKLAAALVPVGALTVRQLGEQWTNGALYDRFGPVNRLRPLSRVPRSTRGRSRPT